MNEVMVYEQKPLMSAEEFRGNYVLSVPGTDKKFKLIRDKDFGLIRDKNGKATVKKPILFKEGADSVFKSYGVFTDSEIESKIERTDKDPFFFYAVKCVAFILDDEKKRVVVASGFGSANTAEKRNGFNGAYDAAHNALRMAKKRAYVDCAVSLGGLSGLFTMDLEDESFMQKANELVKLQDTDPVTTQQMRRIYALGANIGLTANEVKNRIAAEGFASTKDIKQKDYDRVCKLFEEK